jgi:hypothetical protein
LKVNVIISDSVGTSEHTTEEENEMGCRRELLANGEGYAIAKCSCGAYALQIGEVSLRLNSERFRDLAQAMGQVVEEAVGERSVPALEVLPLPRMTGKN